MHKLVLSILLIFTIGLTQGQSIKATIPIRALTDNMWELNLEKDNTYTYIYWTLFGGVTTLDSGNYTLQNSKLLLESIVSNNTERLLHSEYYLEVIRIKNYQRISSLSKEKKFTLFGKKYLVLTTEPFTQANIISLRPVDNIHLDSISNSTSFRNWIEDSILSTYGYSSSNKFPDSSWIELFSNNEVEVIEIKNGFDLFKVIYKVDNIIYTTSYNRDIKYHKTIINVITEKGKLSRKEGKELLSSIDEHIQEVLP